VHDARTARVDIAVSTQLSRPETLLAEILLPTPVARIPSRNPSATALLQLGILATGVVVKPSCRACRTNLRRNALPDLR
jgi:hypothetical protein